MNRIPQLDGLRGLFIVLITINHTENYLTQFTYQPFGYASAAEGFVFLSGLVASLAYNRRLDRSGFAQMRKHALARSLTIYFYHLAVVLTVGMVVYFSAVHTLYWKGVFQGFLAHPLQAALLASLLLYQPNFHDILPLYCILFLSLPLLVTLLRQNRTKLVFAVSLGLWLLSQLGLGISYKLHACAVPLVPVLKLSQMDIFAWQLLFVAGVYTGTRRYQANPIRPSVQWLWICLPFIVLITIDRHATAQTHDWLLERLVDKHRLGILRLANVAALAIVVSLAMKRFPALFNQSWLVVIGKHSLQVFALHVLLVFLLEPVKASYSQNSILSIVFVIFVIGCLYMAARWREAYLRKHKQTVNS
jgi:hypothetical protein